MTARIVSCAVAVLAFGSCRNDMYNQPKKKTLAESEFFADGASARALPAHAIARENGPTNLAYMTASTGGTYVTRSPIKVSIEQLQRGRERYQIYCAVCHGASGDGGGMIPQRGFPAPPSFHEDRLRGAAIGHFVDAMTNGYGAMYSYAARVSPEDRWAIAAYIRALQLSRSARPTELSASDKKAIEAAP